MDPFSLTVGILTLLSAGGTIGKTLNKIITLKAPDILFALNNEVVDLQIVVQDVSNLLHQHSEISQAAPIKSVCFALDKSKRTLLELEYLIAYELTTTTGKNNELRLDRSAWFRLEPKVLKLKNEIREYRLRLSAALSVLSSSTSLGIDAQLRQLRFEVASVSLNTGTARDGLISQVQDLASLVQGSLVSSARQETAPGRFHNEQRTAAAPNTNEGPQTVLNCDSQQSSPLVTDLALARQPGPSGYNISQIAKSNSFKIIGKSCNVNCRCSCHKKGSLKSPRSLTTILGSIMVGYNAIPGLAQRCNDPSCKGQSTNITYTYAFPEWFVSRVVYLNFKNEQSRGPELCLRVVRVRPDNADIFLAVQDDREEVALEHTKRLLLAGEASVLDVKPNGNSVISIAIKASKFDLVDFLISAGSDVFYENNDGISPCTLAWQKLLDPECGEELKGRLRDHFHDDSQLVAFDFPDLTRAFLKISGKDFYNILASTPRSAIDTTDSTGSTTLAWAALQGDEGAVKALLACGADPNHQDTIGRTPLHTSIFAPGPECLRLLLNAKADVDIQDNDGRTALALAVNSRHRTDFSELLLSHGADMECTDKWDWTPLRLAADNNYPNQVSLLLGKGANINASGSGAKRAFHHAIISRCSDVVKILLNNPGLDYERKTKDGSTAIHLAAEYSDLETLEILEAADLTNIDLDAVDAGGDTALDVARWRRDDNENWANCMIEPRDEDPEEWYEAFKELINSIRVSQGKNVLGASVRLLQGNLVIAMFLRGAKASKMKKKKGMIPLRKEIRAALRAKAWGIKHLRKYNNGRSGGASILEAGKAGRCLRDDRKLALGDDE